MAPFATPIVRLTLSNKKFFGIAGAVRKNFQDQASKFEWTSVQIVLLLQFANDEYINEIAHHEDYPLLSLQDIAASAEYTQEIYFIMNFELEVTIPSACSLAHLPYHIKIPLFDKIIKSLK